MLDICTLHESRITTTIHIAMQLYSFLRHLCSDVDDGSSFNDVQPWKPSLYKVFGLTFALGAVWICLCAALYSHVERWDYYIAVYFAFVS